LEGNAKLDWDEMAEGKRTERSEIEGDKAGSKERDGMEWTKAAGGRMWSGGWVE
jgi:hypothetical protein